MQSLFKVLMWLFLLCVFLFSVIFSFFNTQSVVVSLGFVDVAALPLAVWILGAFACGGGLGLVLTAGSLRALRARRENNKLKSKIAALETRLAKSNQE
jgi:putative membrane protein